MLVAKDDIIREEILEEAQKLFRQFGLKKTTMEDIAKAMGKGKSTLYYYFCSKEDIFDAVVRKEMQQVFATVTEAVDKAASAEEKLKAFTVSRIKAVQKRANLYKIVRSEIQENIYCTRHLHAEYDVQEIQLVKDILSFGIRKGEFTRLIEKELDILPAVLVSSLRGMESNMVLEGKFARLETRLESIMGLLIRGLRNIQHNKNSN